MTQINISLPEKLITEAKNHAKSNGQTFSGMIRVGIIRQLEEAQAE